MKNSVNRGRRLLNASRPRVCKLTIWQSVVKLCVFCMLVIRNHAIHLKYWLKQVRRRREEKKETRVEEGNPAEPKCRSVRKVKLATGGYVQRIREGMLRRLLPREIGHGQVSPGWNRPTQLKYPSHCQCNPNLMTLK